MPESIRVLIVLLPVAAFMFILARPLALTAMSRADFNSRRNLWFALTLIVFLSHNFWVYSVLAALLIYGATNKDSNPIATYFFIMFAVPAIDKAIPGFGGINYFFNLSYLRILSIVILLPAALRLFADRNSLPIGKSLTDKLLIAYVAFNLLLVFIAGSLTTFMRAGVVQFLDVLLIYYVASRSVRSIEQFRDLFMSFGVAAIVMVPLGIFETIRHWMLYGPLPAALDANWGFMGVERDNSLRATASCGQPIAFGYVLAIAIGFWLYLQPLAKSTLLRYGSLLALTAGLVASLSRGPWVGAAAISLTFLMLGPKPVANLTKVGIAGAFVLAIAVASPGGERIVNMIPFIGTGEAGTVTYRQRLLEVFVPIILNNPFSGASNYLNSAAAESLRQGEGIIDLVNTFLAVGLRSGLVGLGLFVGVFVAAMFDIWRRMRLSRDRAADDYRLGLTLLSVVLGVLVIIFTVSSITVIPYVYWLLCGLGVAYRFALAPAATATAPKKTVAAGMRPPPRNRGLGKSAGTAV
jgi:hypothetical protein